VRQFRAVPTPGSRTRLLSPTNNEWNEDGRISMRQSREAGVLAIERRPSDELTSLIRKLRWIGLEEEARRLARAASTLELGADGVASATRFGAN
jgi:hypothetical protein